MSPIEHVSSMPNKPMVKERTASRYLLSPARSRYRRQKGSVPKFLLIDFSRDFADVNLQAQIGQQRKFPRTCDNHSHTGEERGARPRFVHSVSIRPAQ